MRYQTIVIILSRLLFCSQLTVPSLLGQENQTKGYRISSNPNPIKLLSSTHEDVKRLTQEAVRLMAKQKFSEARDIYKQTVELAPENYLALANLGVAEFRLKNYRAAELAITQSLEMNPSLAHNWTTLGIIQFKSNQYHLAISSLSRAIHEDPKQSQAHLHLAAICYEKGWTHAAIDNLSRVVELEPQNADAQFNLALTYFTLKSPKVELARRHYYNAIDLGYPKSATIERKLAELSK